MAVGCWTRIAIPVLLILACGSPQERLAEHLRRATEYYQGEQWSEARIEFWNALKLDPDDAEAHFKLAETLVRLREFRDARWEYQEAIRLLPERLEWRMKLGELLVAFNATSDALEQMDEILARDADHTDARVLRAVALARKSRLKEAISEVEHTLRVDADHERALQLDARLREGQGDHAAAEASLERLVDVHPSVRNHLLFALFWASRRENEKAGAEYRTAVTVAKERDERVQALQVLAAFYLNSGDPEAAERELLRAREEAPENAALALTLARLYAAKGQFERAEEMLEARAAQDPEAAEPLLTLADFYRRSGSRDNAILAVDRALELDPESENGRLQKAEYLIENRDDPTSKELGRKLIDEVLDRNPNSVAGLLTLSKALLLEKRYEEAVPKLQRVLDEQPSAQAHLLLGWAYSGMKQHELARSELLRAIQLDPTNPAARSELAALYLRIGEREFAVQEVRKALELRGEDPRLLLVLAEAEIGLGRKDKALAALERISTEPAELPRETRLAIGRLYRQAGQSERAEKILDDALASRPGDPAILRELVAVDLTARNPAKALERMNAAIEQSPEEGELYALRGQLLIGFRKDQSLAFPDEAERDFKMAIEKSPNRIEAYSGLGALYRLTGRLDASIETFEQARDKRPEDPAVRLLLATLYEGAGRTDEAASEYEEVVRLDPKQPIAKNNLAWLLAEASADDPDKLDRALELARDAREFLPGNPNVADTLGWVLLKKDIPNAAIPLFREAIASSEASEPVRALVRLHLARAYRSTGEVGRAIEELEQALEETDQFPARPEAEALLAELRKS